MPSKKIACLGGGSFHYTFFMSELLTAKGLAGSEVVFYDIDREKLQVMVRMVRSLAAQAGTRMKVRGTVNLDDAIDGADYVTTSIGGSGASVGKDVYYSYYHQADMHIPAKYGIHQVVGDTGGPAGMMMALRSIPVYMNICRRMEKRCPRAPLFNNSNPMAVLMRAMHKYSPIQTVGVCHGVQSGIHAASELLKLPPEELDCRWIGTNHYYWFTKVVHKGVDLTEKLMRLAASQKPPEREEMTQQLSALYGHRITYRSDDHIVEFYPFLSCGDPSRLSKCLVEAARSHGFDPAAPMPDDAEADPATRREFLKKYKEIINKTRLVDKSRQYFTIEGTAMLLEKLALGQRAIFIANIPNEGAIPNLPADAEVELQAVMDSAGARPVYMGPAPRTLKGILEKRFAWHELVADAAVKGDKSAALQALLTDEMAILPKQAKAMLDELLHASRKLLPQFFRSRKQF